jgi:hypothetical protein
MEEQRHRRPCGTFDAEQRRVPFVQQGEVHGSDLLS